MRFLLPTGIGDSVWALHKVQAIAASKNDPIIDIGLSCGEAKNKIEQRALDFVRRFSFVNSAKMCPGYAIVQPPAFTPEGYWNYLADGMYEFNGDDWCVLMPNAALERGTRLENWLPHYETRWNIWDDFKITNEEVLRAQAMKPGDALRPYCVFYPGPLDGNTIQGHNRNMIWRPQDWIELGRRVHSELKLDIVAVGAPYDASYYDTLIGPNLNGEHPYWHNRIGETSIGELFSLTLGARFVISYQAGVGIVSTYRGTNTAMFWRQKGDSIVQDGYLSFEEEMASAWVQPNALEMKRYLPLYYGRHDVSYIMKQVRDRLWV